MMRSLAKAKVVALAACVGIGLAWQASAQTAESTLNARCSTCHERQADGGLKRISVQRKTPEGWDMTITRMMIVHGLKITPEEKHTLVKHLADTQGLAPSETAGYRYALERTPGVFDSAPDEDLGALCARCHTFARVALQRRDRDEWVKLGHFHLGQYPTTEYQALGRDRDWFELATGAGPDALAKLLPLETEAWTAWQAAGRRDFSGSWRLVGRQPGRGPYEGRMDVSGGEGDRYDVTLSLTYASGAGFQASGKATVYTGHEWRASLSTANQKFRQVLSLSDDGSSLSGRWFLTDNDVVGGSLEGRRADGPAEVLAVTPNYLRAGEEATVAVAGVGLDGDLDLGSGLDVVEVMTASAESVVARVKAAGDAAVGPRAVAVGAASADGLLTVYDKVDEVRVEPDTTYARVGGGGGPIAPVPAQFEAVGFMNGVDGEAGTDDDLRIGVLPARWSVDNYSDLAAALKDLDYSGAIDQSGLFSPAVAGPNPERKMGTNNVGDLAVIAVVDDAGRAVEGRGHLFVTVQRFIDPPIR